MCIICIVYGAHSMYTDTEPDNWASTMAYVNHAACNKTVTTSGSSGFHTSGYHYSSPNVRVDYGCYLTVTYAANGHTYSERRLVVVGNTRYEKGTMVRIYYNKNDPNKIQLSPDGGYGVVWLVMGLVLGLIFSCTMIAVWATAETDKVDSRIVDARSLGLSGIVPENVVMYSL